MRTLLWAVCLSLIISTTAVAAPLPWVPYDKGLETAKADGRRVYLHFYSNNCGYCEKMDKVTFSNPDVIAFMTENFVPIRVNVDESPDLAKTYMARGVPMGWFLTPAGEPIAPLPGFVPPEPFLIILGYIQSSAYESMTFEDYLKKLMAMDQQTDKPAEGEVPEKASEEPAAESAQVPADKAEEAKAGDSETEKAAEVTPDAKPAEDPAPAEKTQ